MPDTVLIGPKVLIRPRSKDLKKLPLRPFSISLFCPRLSLMTANSAKKFLSILLCSSLLITAPGLPFYSAWAQVHPAGGPGPASFSGSIHGLGAVPPAARLQLAQDLRSYIQTINSISLNPYTFPQKMADSISGRMQSPQATASEKAAGTLLIEALARPESLEGMLGFFGDGTGSAEGDRLLSETMTGLIRLSNILHGSQPERRDSVLIALVPLQEALASDPDTKALKAELDAFFAGSAYADPAPVFDRALLPGSKTDSPAPQTVKAPEPAPSAEIPEPAREESGFHGGLSAVMEKNQELRPRLTRELLHALPSTTGPKLKEMVRLLTVSAQADPRFQLRTLTVLLANIKHATGSRIRENFFALQTFARERSLSWTPAVKALIENWSRPGEERNYKLRYEFTSLLKLIYDSEPEARKEVAQILLETLAKSPLKRSPYDLLAVLHHAASKNPDLWPAVALSLTEKLHQVFSRSRIPEPADEAARFLSRALYANPKAFAIAGAYVLVRLAKAAEPDIHSIARLMGRLHLGMLPPLKDPFWLKLKGFMDEKDKKPGLRRVRGSSRWHPGQEEVLKRRMPTLWKILSRPQKLGKFLFVLSLLRLAYPYDTLNLFEGTPLAVRTTKGDHMVQFELHELRLVPVSESFRRHIIYTEDEEGLFAVEIKMPGEKNEKTMIHPTHFEIAQQLWDRYPDDPGVSRPIHFSQYRGKVPLYGKKSGVVGKERLGVMVFGYEDGKRLKNSESFLRVLAESKGTDRRSILNQVLTDAAVAAIRLHRLGWRGADKSATDMHTENVRVLTSGRGSLVGDFGAFEPAKLTLKQRSEETLSLLGNPGRETLEAIYPEVLRRMTEKVEDPKERAQIEREVPQELNLWELETQQ